MRISLLSHFHDTFIFCLSSILLFIISFSSYSSEPLKVGTYYCPPFVFNHQEQTYDGLSLQLWHRISEIMQVDYTVSHYELDELLKAAEAGDIDVGVSCISITPNREKYVDFSHSFYETHLAIAVKNQRYWEVFLSVILNKTLWKALAVFCVVAAIIGGFYYYLERKNNDKLYSMPTKKGRIAEALLLGVLFITKGPFNYFEFKTLSARIMTVIIAMFSTVFIASITAVLASSLTLEQLRFDVKSVNDLSKLRVGAKQATTGALLLANHSIIYEKYATVSDLLDALENNDIDAVVSDDAVLRYMIKNAKEQGRWETLTVLPYQLEKQNYGLVLMENSPYEEEINQALLQIRETTDWHQILLNYFSDN